MNGLPAPGALDGIRVVDLTRILAGPFCTQLLGDLGAEVIKVEGLDGDPVRGQGTLKDEFSGYFAQFNRNKRSIALNTREPRGRDVLHRLLVRADVLVENFRPGVLAKLGLDDETLARRYPQLVVCSINGFGSTGPYSDRPAFDFIAQAMSGFMAVNGPPDGEPMRAAPPISDLVAGLYGALGVCAALQARTRSGRGQRVETAMTNGLISLLGYLSAEYFTTGRAPERTGNHHPIVSPYGPFRAADGEIAIAPSNDTFVRRLLEALELGHILKDPRFADNAARVKNRVELTGILNLRLGEADADTWIRRLNAAGVPCGRVQGLDEVFNDPQVLAQEMVLTAEHGEHGPIRMTGFPLKFSATPAALHRTCPELGEDTGALLREHGFDDAVIDALHRDGIVGGLD